LAPDLLCWIVRAIGVCQIESRLIQETTPLGDPEHYQYDLNLRDIAEVWRRGSVIASWLLDLSAAALVNDPAFSGFAGKVADSGEGRWTIKAAIDEAVPVPVLSTADGFLDNLCWVYDNNHITIEGSTRITFTEDTAARFLGYGWNVLRVGDANDIDRIEHALDIFRRNKGAQPSSFSIATSVMARRISRIPPRLMGSH
jgi:Transketolase, thiamine diphosphate binding domain/6-phosphogluconate dehydrogenase, C-terminal domain